MTTDTSISESAQIVKSPGEENPAQSEARYERAAAEYVAPDTLDAAATLRTGRAYGASSLQIAEAQVMSELFDTPVIFGDGAQGAFADGVNAIYDRRDGMITINPQSTRTVWSLCASEMTHALESTAEYGVVSDFALSHIAERDGSGRSFEQIFADKKRTYEAHEGRALDDDYIRREIVEEFAGQYLFDDKEMISKFVSKAPKGARRVMAWLDRTLMRFKLTSPLGRLIHSDLRQARENYAAAVREIKKSYTEDADSSKRYSIDDVTPDDPQDRAFDESTNEAIAKHREEVLRELDEGSKEQRDERKRLEERDRRTPPELPDGYKGMSEGKIQTQLDNRSVNRGTDRQFDEFAREEERRKEKAEVRAENSRRKSEERLDKLMAEQRARFFAEDNGIGSEDIDEIAERQGRDAALLATLATQELYDGTDQANAATVERLAKEANAVRDAKRETITKRWSELSGGLLDSEWLFDSDTREKDSEVIEWNRRLIDSMIKISIEKNRFSKEEAELAEQIASGERDASHVQNEERKQTILYLSEMYASKRWLENKPHTTSLLQKNDIFIDSPLLSNYIGANAMVGFEHAKKRLDSDILGLKKKIDKVCPATAEKIFSASESVAKGINTPDSFAELSREEKNYVKHLGRMMQMRSWLTKLGAPAIRAKVKERFGNVLEQQLLPDPTIANRLSWVKLNSTTFVRNNISVFGEETGTKINDALFRPVVRNEGERTNFVNRELQEFSDTFGELSDGESALLQFMIESQIGSDNISGKDLAQELENYLDNINPEKGVRRRAGVIAKSHSVRKAKRYQKMQMDQWDADVKQIKKTLADISSENLNKLAKASDFMRGKYSVYYEMINEALVMHGYKPIPFRSGYAPHMQRDQVKSEFLKISEKMGFGINLFDVPTALSGRTDIFKPGKKWDPHLLERTGEPTQIDAVKGFTRYVSYMSEILYHTDDIQKLRQFSEYIRTYFADSATKAKLEESLLKMKHNEIAEEELAALNEKLLEKTAENTALSGYVSVLDDYANVLAGKQTKFDRGWESFAGRKALEFLAKPVDAFTRAAIVGNLTSALNQTVQLTQVWSECGIKNFNRAVADALNHKTGLNKTIGFDDLSTFITGKRGIKSLKSADGIDLLTEKGQIPFELVDDLASRIIVRTKYFQLVSEGVSAERAIILADEYADSVVGSRMKGAKPMLFCSKNVVARLLTKFQLEVANAWDHILRDLPREIRSLGAERGKKAVVAMILKQLLSAFLLNRLFDELYGQTPVMFDVIGYFYESLAAGFGVSSASFTEKILNGTLDTLGEFNFGSAATQLGESFVDDVPFVSSLATMSGLNDGSSRLALPNFMKLKDVPEDIRVGLKQLKYAKDAGEYVGSIGRMFNGLWATGKSAIPFGNQINKSVTGVMANWRGGSYDYYGDGDRAGGPYSSGWRLRYPQTGASFDGVTSVLFGSGANKCAGDFYASGYEKLSVRGTLAYKELTETGMEHVKAYDYIRALEAIKGDETEREKVDTSGMDFFDAMKTEFFYGDSLSEEEKAAQKARQTRLEKQIELLDSSSKLTDDQREILFRATCADSKITGAMRKMASDDAKVVYNTVRDVVTTKPDEGDPTRAQLIAASKLSERGKAELWYAAAASKTQREQFTLYRDWGDEAEDIYAAFRGIDEAKAGAEKGERAKAGRASIAKSKLSDESKYDMYYNSYTDTSPVPDVMDDLTEHGAKNGDVVRWLAAYDSAKGVGREAVEETLRRGYTADQSAGGDTAAQMKALLGTNMTARELEAVYFGMMVSSQAKERRREQFDKLHDAGGNAVDFFEAYVAVAETSWKTKESGAKSKALKRAIDGVTSDRRVRKELYDIFDVAKSMR